MDVHDYLDKFPGQYESEQQKYARGMDDFYRKVDAIALKEYGSHYEELSVKDQKIVESKVEMQGSRKGDAGTEVYRLDDGRVVGAQEAQNYQNNYVKMMEEAHEEYMRNRKGNPINNVDPKIGQGIVGKNVSGSIIGRMTRGN